MYSGTVICNGEAERERGRGGVVILRSRGGGGGGGGTLTAHTSVTGMGNVATRQHQTCQRSGSGTVLLRFRLARPLSRGVGVGSGGRVEQIAEPLAGGGDGSSSVVGCGGKGSL